MKLLVDVQFPAPVVAQIRAAKINIEVIDNDLKSHPDPDILAFAQKKGRVLLTLDEDFWDDKRYPLQTIKTGIIYIAEPPNQHDRILRAFGLVYGCFAKSYPLNWWNMMKIKATMDEFEIKMRTWEGKVTRYKMKLQNGRLMACELER